MRVKPPSVPSALARREAARSLLAGAVDCRDAQAVLSFTGHWVHRQGMDSLPPLMAELAQGETLLWWQSLLQQPIENVVRGPIQAPESPASEQPAPAPQASAEVATSPPIERPAEQIGADPEGSTAAESPAIELQPEHVQSAQFTSLVETKPETSIAAPATTPVPTPATAPAPVVSAVPVSTAMPAAPLPLATATPPAPRQAVAQVRRGAGTSRPAPAPRNPELARLRAWLPDGDALGGASNRSHAA